MGQSCGKGGGPNISHELDIQIDLLDEKLTKAEQAITDHIAKDDATSKQLTLQAMKKRKLLEVQRQQILGLQFNVENLADQFQQAEVTLKAVAAIREGRDKLKQVHAKMSFEEICELLDETEELADETHAIGSSLAQGALDDSLETEYTALRRQHLSAASRCTVSGEAKVLGNCWASQVGREAFMPAPPPPPPPRANKTRAHSKNVGYDGRYTKSKADEKAAEALSKALAPYGVLDLSVAAAAQPVLRIPIMA